MQALTTHTGLDLQDPQPRIESLFLAVLAHELRTSFHTTLGWISLLKRGLDKDLTEKAYSVIESSVNSQTRLIEDIFDLERVRSGKFRLDLQRVELETEIESAVQAMRPSANTKSVVLQTRIFSQPVVMADPQRLLQVITNLLANSIKFTPAGGWVEIAVRSFGDTAQVTVADNGQGITSDLLPFLFVPYVTAEGDDSVRGKSGLGLGLPLVKLLVEMHGGRVVAESAGTGCGSSFTIALPLIGDSFIPGNDSGRTATQ
jgi:signal transduction histidine kinase